MLFPFEKRDVFVDVVLNGLDFEHNFAEFAYFSDFNDRSNVQNGNRVMPSYWKYDDIVTVDLDRLLDDFLLLECFCCHYCHFFVSQINYSVVVYLERL